MEGKEDVVEDEELGEFKASKSCDEAACGKVDICANTDIRFMVCSDAGDANEGLNCDGQIKWS